MNHKRSAGESIEEHGSYPEIDSQGGSIGREVGLPRNSSIEDLRTQATSTSLFKNKTGSTGKTVNPPAIMTTSM